MFHVIYDALDTALGLSLESRDLTWHHMALRALLTFIIMLGIVRCAHKRFLGKATAFDVVLGILLGSIFAPFQVPHVGQRYLRPPPEKRT